MVIEIYIKEYTFYKIKISTSPKPFLSPYKNKQYISNVAFRKEKLKLKIDLL